MRGYRTTILKDPPPLNKSHEDFDDIWPLELVDMKDEAMVDTLYLLLHSLPHAVECFLGLSDDPFCLYRHMHVTIPTRDYGANAIRFLGDALQ